MEALINIKHIFDDANILKIYAHCVYMPSQDKLNKRAAEYKASNAVRIFGSYHDEQITGVIVVESMQNNIAEIKGIAVDPEFRQRGIGKRLIEFARGELSITELRAETDDDAVAFYRSCGFRTEKFDKAGKDGTYTRYKCVLNKDQQA